MLSVYFSFAIAITLLISSPGPVISLVIADSKHGWPTGTLLGAAISALLLLMAALLLIHFALALDENLLDWGRIIGGGYLAYLGIKMLSCSVSITPEQGHHKDCFWRAMRVGLSNPKDILFLLAFLPSFILPEQNFLEQSIILFVIWAVIDMSIMVIYAGAAKRLLNYQVFQTLLHYLPGAFMVFMGGLSSYLGLASLMGW